jgi:putative Holliday junction resolvase
MFDVEIPNSLKNKMILSIDYGQKFTGLAYFHTGRDPYPLPLDRIQYNNDENLIKSIKQYIDDEMADVVVVGVPYFTDGTESKMTKIVKDFINKLSSSIQQTVYEQDEALSSYEAKQRMENSPRYNFKIDMKQIDALAASIILEDFLKSSQDL